MSSQKKNHRQGVFFNANFIISYDCFINKMLLGPTFFIPNSPDDSLGETLSSSFWLV